MNCNLKPEHKLFNCLRPSSLTALFLLLLAPLVAADRDDDDDDETPLGAAVILIELTDNDIELQVFADAFDWNRLRIYDPKERLVFDAKARGKLRRQGGMSEMAWASEPSHYLEDEPDYDESVADFLKRWPEGEYEFEAHRLGGLGALESEAYLSHVLAALPQVITPQDEAVVSAHEPLLIAWEPVTTRYIGEGPVNIIEYQVIVNQETPERAQPWIDGGTRRSLINLPAAISKITVPAEILEPGATYEIEILAIEANGNASIGVVEFETYE